MIDLFKTIIEFIKDNSIKKVSKIFVFLVIIITFLFVDNISGFSYYYNLNNKLSQIEKVSNLLNNKNLDILTRNELIKIRKDLIVRKTIKDNIQNTWSEISFTDSNDKILNKTDSSSTIRNSTIEFISLNYFWILLFIFMPFYAIISPFTESFWKNVATLLIAEISIASFAFSLFFIFSLIPTIYNKPYLNYILNFLIVTIALTINTHRLNKKQLN